MIIDFIKALRRNHAIEHATATILATRMKPGTRIAGRATGSGFHIYGNVSTEEVSQAAQEGLTRLKRGECELAVTPFCGTNLVAAAVLVGLASFITIGGRRKSRSLSAAILTSLIALIVAQPLGRMAQKHMTTSYDVGDVDIAGVTSRGQGRRTRHQIKTLQG
jgi:hypothetical protein